MKTVRFCEIPKVVVFDQGYARWTMDKDGKEIPMRIHRSQTYRRAIVGKFYHDFIHLIATNDPWAIGMVDFANEIYRNISIITNSREIDMFLRDHNKLFEHFFKESVKESMLVESVYDIIRHQTIFYSHHKTLFNNYVSKFQKVLYDHHYVNRKIYVCEGALACSKIYETLIDIYKMYLAHPDLIY